MAFEGFGKNYGPTIPPKTNTLFGNNSPPNPSPNLLNNSPNATLPQPQQPPQQSQRPVVSPPNFGNQPKLPVNIAYSGNYQRLYPGAPFVNARDAETRSQVEPVNLHFPKRTRPPFSPTDEDFLGAFHSTEADSERTPIGRLDSHADMRFEHASSEVPKRMHSPPLAFESNRFAKNLHSPHGEAQRPDEFPPRLGNQQKSPVNDSNSLLHQRLPTIAPYVSAHDSGILSPPMPINSHAPKRTRSPPLPYAVEASNGIIHSVQFDSEREMQAKAKRLARFNVELSQPVQSHHDLTRHKSLGSKPSLPSLYRQKVAADGSTVEVVDAPSEGILSDYDGLESSTVIVGLCPDMCPMSEREERERKGDLDKYERLDGERNQTNISLAVKKYNRTAEREAELIRPMPVLQKTVDYLLKLLDQPYDNKFLGIYNFCWDRMRAIRMDLRMQHLFNRDAIVMLEKMIRLHIIAMHELCEYKKGEGFSEGFDAHLNIEQMNKTSVDLFQMYNDHRKQGSSILTEREFRGYYALLKLDKHPGYNVEPAELSLDLAKMTPEIRCTPEISFARDVARACRTGNFIAFFRLARRATFLQACLMHAHFAKLRSLALASLHSGLQNNQGIPVQHVVKWLGMEGEDIESLLEYHGFVIKNFEDTYMVKEGPFLNSDMDYPTKCSELVCLKKSRRIIDDVCSSQTLPCPSEGRKVVSDMVDKIDPAGISATEGWVTAVDEDMLDFEVDSTPKDVNRQPMLKGPSPISLNRENEGLMTEICPSGVPYASTDDFLSCHPLPALEGQVVESDEDTSIDGMPLLNVEGSVMQVEEHGNSNSCSIVNNPFPHMVVSKHIENEELVHHKKDEAARETLKLILRIWKQQAVKKKEIREQREVLANAALSSLSLGPPVRQNEELSHSGGELNLDYVVRERDGRRGKSWSRLNVSEVVAPILSSRSPEARCLCWKLIVCFQVTDTESKINHLASTWLLSKLMGSGMENDNELVYSSASLSIWKKLVNTQVGFPQCCCLSVIREAVFHNNRPVELDDMMVGVNAVMFLVSESIPWDIQRFRIHNLLMSIQSGSRLSLLILSSDAYGNGITDPSSMIINRLGLQDADKTRINGFSVVFLIGNCPLEHFNGFFSDEHLRQGLQWLANKSPLQPILRQAKTRDLVLRYLDSSLAAFDSMKLFEVGPDKCISIFNEALDYSAEEIRVVADMNLNCWPSPEIDLLEELSDERQLVNMFLPSTGWSSARRIEPIIRAIKGCKLPSFSNDLPWLNQGSHMGREIPNQKLSLEECIMRYLTQTRIMSGDLAAREAHIMVQKGAGLELRGSSYYIIPRWVMIFKRIYNWRLMNLTSGEFTVAYVLDRDVARTAESHCRGDSATSSKSEMSPHVKDGGYQMLHSVLTELSLDEMIEIGCSVPFAQQQPLCEPASIVSLQQQSFCEPVRSSERTADTAGDVSEIPECSKDNEDLWLGDLSETDVSVVPNNQMTVAKGQGFDKLEMLLKQCNMVQNMIDEKLAIYF